MTTPPAPIVLGSRSPRRRELLALLVGAERIVVRPPLDPTESKLDDVTELDSLQSRLTQIARHKSEDVVAQLRAAGSLAAASAVLTADTVIVGRHPDGRIAVLGQPPATNNWQSTVREWFTHFYIGKTHLVMTSLCVVGPKQQLRERVVTTAVRFRDDGRQWLEWYLATGEPIGKSGGYGLQGAGSLFVEEIDGSPSNVIGLPLWETADLLESVDVELFMHS